MASHIKRGESILIPFKNGQSIYDSQLKPRMYKSKKAFLRAFPGYYLYGNSDSDVALAEYAEVVRCNDCKHFGTDGCAIDKYTFDVVEEGFCSYGERREGE